MTAGDLGDATRFSMLETVRQFAHRQLEATGAGDGVRSRHAAYFAGWLDAMGLDLQRAELEQRFRARAAEIGAPHDAPYAEAFKRIRFS